MIRVAQNFNILMNVKQPLFTVHAVNFQRKRNFLVQKNVNLQNNITLKLYETYS